MDLVVQYCQYVIQSFQKFIQHVTAKVSKVAREAKVAGKYCRFLSSNIQCFQNLEKKIKIIQISHSQ